MHENARYRMMITWIKWRLGVDRHKINYIVILKIRNLLFLKYASDMITSMINIMFPIIIGKIIETVFYRADPKLFIKWGAAYTIVFVLKKIM